jgi:phenylalanine-4-hydroxylase
MTQAQNQIEFNEVTAKLPENLHAFIVKQPYNDYTAQNQAVWRYVMRLNVDYLKKVAHESYIDGLRLTGISIDEIPHMEGMNRILKDIGWAAVAVDGFIPPNAFMEFQAHNVLVISSDIRTIDHVGYTPAPDIIHEAAGHAPIIANPEYAEYLRRFGELGSKAISSPDDDRMYEAIRKLSILKENPNSTQAEVDAATAEVEAIQNEVAEPSEMAKIRNLHWWTVEYGLIGSLEDPKIYGAGLLSSIEESKDCLDPSVEKRPYTIEAAEVSFDITAAQPHLYVTPNFAHLSFVLEKFANKMAVRTGGLSGLQKLIKSTKMGTVELSTGIQISGIFTRAINHEGAPIYLQTQGPTALASQGRELIGHGTHQHRDGFGSPVGKLEGTNLAIEDMSPRDLEAYGIVEGQIVTLNFEGGVCVEGKIVTGKRDIRGKIQLITFKECRVTYGDELLFDPSWGVYDMAVGKSLVSAFSGPADDKSFKNIHKKSDTVAQKIVYSPQELALHKEYALLKTLRETLENAPEVGASITELTPALNEFWQRTKIAYAREWLLFLELLELMYATKHDQGDEVRKHLEDLAQDKTLDSLINNGLDLIPAS